MFVGVPQRFHRSLPSCTFTGRTGPQTASANVRQARNDPLENWAVHDAGVQLAIELSGPCRVTPLCPDGMGYGEVAR